MQRLDVKVGPLGPPLRDQFVDLIGEFRAGSGRLAFPAHGRDSFHAVQFIS